MMGRLTTDLKSYCMICSDRPLIGKCDLGENCFNRQIWRRLKAYEDTGLTPEQVAEFVAPKGYTSWGKSTYRGHEIGYDGNEWRYTDTGGLVDEMRPCKKCNQSPTPEGYDACLGHIEGLTSACCGHGDPEHQIFVTEFESKEEAERLARLRAAEKQGHLIILPEGQDEAQKLFAQDLAMYERHAVDPPNIMFRNDREKIALMNNCKIRASFLKLIIDRAEAEAALEKFERRG